MRGLARIWANLFFHKVHFLNPGALPDAGATLLLIGHPASFLDAVLLVTAFQRHIHCLLDRRFMSGFLRGLAARFLDFIPFDREGDGFTRAVEQAQAILRDGETLLVFAEEQIEKSGEPHHFFSTPAAIAMQAEAQSSGELWLEVFPVHLFLPVAQLYASELVIHVDAPLIPKEYLAKGGNLSEQARALADAAEESCRSNVLRLQPEDVRLFLADLEEILRADLAEEWARRPHWKQKVEGFGMSRFVAEWVEEMNGLHPGQLAALRDLLESYREARRQCALGDLEVEQSGEWARTSWRRMAAWIESVLGLPVAIYGLINHLVPGLILHRAGMLENKEGQSQSVKWAVRAFVVLSFYVFQSLLCAHWFGRSITGSYVLTLPLSGLFLLRYDWLIRNRTRLLLLNLRTRRQSARLLPMRKELIRELNTARDTYAATLGLAR